MNKQFTTDYDSHGKYWEENQEGTGMGKDREPSQTEESEKIFLK